MSRVAEVLSCTGIERVKFILLSLTHTEEYPRLKWSLEPYADILFVIDFVGILGSLAYHLFRGSETLFQPYLQSQVASTNTGSKWS